MHAGPARCKQCCKPITDAAVKWVRTLVESGACMASQVQQLANKAIYRASRHALGAACHCCACLAAQEDGVIKDIERRISIVTHLPEVTASPQWLLCCQC